MVVFICNRWGVDISRHSPNLWLDSKRSCTCSTCHGMLVVVGTTQFEIVAVRTFLSVTCCLSDALILYNNTKRPCKPVASRCLSLLFHTCHLSESYYVAKYIGPPCWYTGVSVHWCVHCPSDDAKQMMGPETAANVLHAIDTSAAGGLLLSTRQAHAADS